MPFNPSGLLVRLHNWVSDRDAGTKILAERMDQEFDNAFTGINAILSGEQAFLGPIEVPFGTAAEPAVQIGGEMGIYRKTATALGVSVGGVEVATIANGKMQVRSGGALRDVLHTASQTDFVKKSGDTMTAPLFVATSVYAVSPDGATNAHFWLRDDAGTNRATLFADPAGAGVTLRKYTPAGATACDLELTDTGGRIGKDLTVGTGKVMHATRATSEIGCVVFAKSSSADAKFFGETISGSNLRVSDNTAHSGAGGTLVGTWRCLGGCQPGNSSMFVRIA